MTHSLRRLALAATAIAGLAGGAQAATLLALTADGRLLHIDTETRRVSAPVSVRNAGGALLGIDVRPADGKVYGVTVEGAIVTIDPMTGAATKVSQLSERFDAGGRAVVDFNPVADRLRLMGATGMNFRVNVENGQVARDGQLKYQAGTPLAETMPRITAGAYTNSMAGAQQTMLLTIDAVLGQLNLQAPPNDGVQQMRGRIEGVSGAVAFDIASAGGANTGYLLASGVLHTINLETGAPTRMGPVEGAAQVIDIAVMP